MNKKPTWKNTLHSKNYDGNLAILASSLGYDYYVGYEGRVYDVVDRHYVCTVESLDAEHDALVCIAAWDFPSTGKY